MRRTLLPLGCLLFADLAAAADLSGRAILSYQDFEAETLSSDSFFRSYDLRFERRPIDPLRFRIGIRADQRDGSVDAGAGPTGQDFSQLQPNAELLYALSTFQLQGNYDRIRSRVLVDAGPERERFLERWTGQLSWRPEGLPGLSLQSERRNVQDLSAQIDRIETLFQGTLDYRFKGLMASAITRRQDLDDERAVFARKSRQNEGLLGYDSSLAGGRVSASASLLVSNTHLDEQARAGAVSVPTPVPITRALFAVDDTPGESRDQPPSPVPALIDGNLERGTGLQFGPDGASYQNLSLDLGRPQTLDAFRLHVRDVEGKVVGVAARHWGTSDRGLTTTWSLLIPSRGALLLSAPGETRGAVDRALQGAGHSAGAEWSGELAVTLTPTELGSVVAGSGEFDGLGGSYTETWSLTGVVDAGELRGTIEWYDKAAIKIHRPDAPNILLLKDNIKYMWKENEDKGQDED